MFSNRRCAAVWICLFCVVVVGGAPGMAQAGAKTKALREAIEYGAHRLGKKLAPEAAESLAARAEKLAARYGDDVAVVLRKTGPEAIKALEQAGRHGDDVLKLFLRHDDEALWITARPDRMAIFLKHGGDDVAEALVKHQQIAADLLERFGRPAAGAVRNLNGRNARRLAALADEPVLASGRQTVDLLGVIERFGDRGMEFVWRHKGTLAVSAALAAFLADPEPFIDGTRELAVAAVARVGEPLAEAGGEALVEASRRTNWTLVAWVAMGVIVTSAAWRWPALFRRRTSARTPSDPTPRGVGDQRSGFNRSVEVRHEDHKLC